MKTDKLGRQPNESAGLHLIMDAYVSNGSIFTKETIQELFAKLVQALEMKMLAEPHIYEVSVDPEILKRVQETGNFEDEGGITGVVVISTSHMSIHCWPLQRFLSLDAFSCKNFDSNKAIQIIREHLKVISDNIVVHERRKPHLN